KFAEKAIVQRFEPEFNASKGTLGVHCRLPDPQHIYLPGMYAGVRMPMGKPRHGLVVPRSALRGKPGCVWVVANGIVEERQVKLKHVDDHVLVIEEGLQATDWVITSIPGKIHRGDRVDARRKKLPEEDSKE